jgi:xanthine dehydrogenase accessory factor
VNSSEVDVHCQHRGDVGIDVVRVTVVRVEGSAPREPGAKMLVTAAALAGTIGGGQLEFDAIATARAMLADGTSVCVRRIALGPSLGQCCGGAVVLLFERTTAGDPGHPRPHVVATVVEAPAESAVTVGARLVVTRTRVWGTWLVPALEADAVAAARAMPSGTMDWAETTVVRGHTLLLDRRTAGLHVVLFGAGHVGRALAAILATLPCSVTWIDERPGAYPDRVGDNVCIEPSDVPEGEVDAAPPGACFVVMTHSHHRDLAIVERVLARDDVAYLGVIGSSSKRRRFEQRLLARGVDAVRLARLRCPIGLADVPGKHPGAIAVGVAAELLRVCGGG